MNSTVTDAIASTAGGFIVKSLARLVVDGSVLRHMTSRGAAGVMLADFAASGVFHNTTIHNSSALGGEGGVAVLADSATVTISNSVITNSTCVLLFGQSSAARTLLLLTPRHGCPHSAGAGRLRLHLVLVPGVEEHLGGSGAVGRGCGAGGWP